MKKQISPDQKQFRPKSGRLLDQVREVLRYHHYALTTERSYIGWIKQFIRFNELKHPKDIGREEIGKRRSNLYLCY